MLLNIQHWKKRCLYRIVTLEIIHHCACSCDTDQPIRIIPFVWICDFIHCVVTCYFKDTKSVCTEKINEIKNTSSEHHDATQVDVSASQQIATAQIESVSEYSQSLSTELKARSADVQTFLQQELQKDIPTGLCTRHCLTMARECASSICLLQLNTWSFYWSFHLLVWLLIWLLTFLSLIISINIFSFRKILNLASFLKITILNIMFWVVIPPCYEVTRDIWRSVRPSFRSFEFVWSLSDVRLTLPTMNEGTKECATLLFGAHLPNIQNSFMKHGTHTLTRLS